MRKIARQLAASISAPPMRGPIAPAAAPAAAQVPIALPRSSPAKALPNVARLLGSSIAALIPCTTRPAISQGRPGAAAHRIEAIPKAPTPHRNTQYATRGATVTR